MKVRRWGALALLHTLSATACASDARQYGERLARAPRDSSANRRATADSILGRSVPSRPAPDAAPLASWDRKRWRQRGDTLFLVYEDALGCWNAPLELRARVRAGGIVETFELYDLDPAYDWNQPCAGELRVERREAVLAGLPTGLLTLRSYQASLRAASVAFRGSRVVAIGDSARRALVRGGAASALDWELPEPTQGGTRWRPRFPKSEGT